MWGCVLRLINNEKRKNSRKGRIVPLFMFPESDRPSRQRYRIVLRPAGGNLRTDEATFRQVQSDSHQQARSSDREQAKSELDEPELEFPAQRSRTFDGMAQKDSLQRALSRFPRQTRDSAPGKNRLVLQRFKDTRNVCYASGSVSRILCMPTTGLGIPGVLIFQYLPRENSNMGIKS